MNLLMSRMIPVLLGTLFAITPVNPGYVPSTEMAVHADLEPPFLSADSAWVDSVMSSMSLDDKIAQLIMVPAWSTRDESHLDDLLKLVERHKVGGIIFFQGGPVRQAHMTNLLQEASETPLLIAMDAEWGLGMRLDSVISYPRQMMLGAIRDKELICQMGQDIGLQLNELGVHMNFAPVADINNNPANPVINTRSFGENRHQVSARVDAYVRGLHRQNILVTAKHFPGHGDTQTDSHYDLPVLDFDSARLDSLELFPFRYAVSQGVSGIMVAHLHVPVIDDRENRPTTLSKAAVTGLLKDEIGFRGLVVTDAMNMRGVRDHFDPGDAELEAFRAGNDIILMPSDVRQTIRVIRRAVRRGEVEESRIDASCRKVLMAKHWVGLDSVTKVQTDGLHDRLNDTKYLPLREDLALGAITLVKDEEGVLPFSGLEDLQLATLNFGVSGPTPMTSTMDLYHKGDHFYYENPDDFPPDSLLEQQLGDYNALVINLYYTRSFGNNYDIPPELPALLNRVRFNGKMVVNLFGYPYALEVLGPLEDADAVMVSYTTDSLNQHFAAQGVFGGTMISGQLPVTAGAGYPVGTGIQTFGGTRLGYRSPASVSMNSDTLMKIDSIINEAITGKAMPGCQVLIAKDGQVVWNRSYGYHTYLKRREVKNHDLYDLASITKIASTIPAIMKLYDQERFSVDSTLGSYVHGMDTSAKANLMIRDVLTHQAGLQAWIPFYTSTLEPMDTSQRLFDTHYSDTYPFKIGPAAYANRNIRYRDSIYSRTWSTSYPVRVADDLYMRSAYRDSIYETILRSPLGDSKYLYSDLGYYYLYRVVEDISGMDFYPYLQEHFFGPVGAGTLGFLPLDRFDRARITPTENDLVFRRQLVHGHVHDPGAAMLGGICGHAGMFSNANDLAKMMQVFLNFGTYGGDRFIDSATIAEFTRCQFCDFDNRRALGFDRPITEEDDAGPACNSASERSYGHSGFTGTIVWMDPEYDLLYVFLSNRVHPDQHNAKLITGNVRTNIQEIIYRSFLTPGEIAPGPVSPDLHAQ